MDSMDDKGLKNLTAYNGLLVSSAFPADSIKSALEFYPKNETILICTYPKCGTTWMESIVYSLMHNGEPFPAHLRMIDKMPFLEMKGAEYSADYSVIKTHLPRNLLHWNPEAKYIFVARNPKDCCVSYYHHVRGFIKVFDYADGTFDEFFEFFLNGKVPYNDYFDHLMSWLPHMNDPNVFFCTYEQLKTDTKEAMKKLAKFIDVNVDGNTLEKVLQNSSFDSMKNDLQRWAPLRPEGMPAFIRKGEIGDWRNHFTQEQSDRMDMKIEQYPLIKELWSGYI